MTESRQGTSSKSSLDTLMMAYTDLSNVSSSMGFKGPSLKDLKVTKAEKTNYYPQQTQQPSQRARDWSNFESNLENAFIVENNDDEEWGDFSQPTTKNDADGITSKGGGGDDDDDDDDDFENFISSRENVVGSRLASSQRKSPIHQFKESSSDKKEIESKSVDDFGDFIGPPTNGLKSSTDFDFLHLTQESSTFHSHPLPVPVGLSPTNILDLPSLTPDVIGMDTLLSPPPTTSAPNVILGPSPTIEKVQDLLADFSIEASSSNTLQPPEKEDRYSVFRQAVAGLDGNPIETWYRILSKAHILISQALDSFSGVDVMEEVLEDPRGRDYVTNLVEIYRVTMRINRSFRQIEEIDTSMGSYGKVKDKLDAVTKTWTALADLIIDSSRLTLAEFEDVPCKRKDDGCCGICCLNLDGEPSSRFNDAICRFKDRRYHCVCANFWVNCVDSSALPDL